MPIPAPKATRTGGSVLHPAGTIYEVICPICDMTQWHKAGIARCIFCGARMSVVILELVPPVIAPEPNDEADSSPKETHGSDSDREQ